ncbi:MAG: molybdopterin oxidoreductase, partial [Candidatus Thioglobus sp.]|nr:molybdopterin oxidoreductase [Candidatus Thioglobus sp.]
MNIRYQQIEGKSLGFYTLITVFTALIFAALGAVYYMEHHGHFV